MGNVSKLVLKIGGLGVCVHYPKRAEPGIPTLLETMAAAKKEGETEKESDRRKKSKVAHPGHQLQSVSLASLPLCVLRMKNTGRVRKWERGGKERAVRKFPFPDPGDGTCVGRVSV